MKSENESGHERSYQELRNEIAENIKTLGSLIEKVELFKARLSLLSFEEEEEDTVGLKQVSESDSAEILLIGRM